MLKDDVLYILERQRGQLVTGGWLAKKLGVSRTAIWKTIHALEEDGNTIRSQRGSGYRLEENSDALSARLITKGLTTEFLGRKLIFLPTVHSTNQYLREFAEAEAVSGTVVIADEQTGGRGRRNRPFLSPKGEGVYLSLLLRLDRAGMDIRPLTLCAAVAVAQAIEAVCGAQAAIKWVNDVYLGGRKVSGILTEAVLSAELQELTTVVVGIGINTGSIPEEISGIATSIREAAGVRGIRNRLAATVLNRFEPLYRAYAERGDKQALMREYEGRLFILNKTVTVTAAEQTYTATVTGIDETGALLVRDEASTARTLVSGEITLDWSELV
jgi:BirA family biotin operon repressor/biotin-[acetyl-CoA-carboxylase] ligase